jgi:hypothetical protein
MDKQFTDALLSMAQELVKADSAKSEKYLLSQVRNKLQDARERHPNDQAITAAFFAVDHKCTRDPGAIVTKAEMNNLFNDVIGLRTSSQLRSVLGEYIDEQYQPTKAENVFAGQRMQEAPLEYELDKVLSNNLNGAFDDSVQQATHTEEELAVGKKMVELELRSLGFSDIDVSFVSGDSTGLLYNAGLMTPTGQQSIAVPLQIAEGKLCMPAAFVSNGTAIAITRDNIVNALLVKANDLGIEEKYNFDDVVEVPKYELTDDVKDLAPQMDDLLFESQLPYESDVVQTAKQSVKDTLYSLGFLSEVSVATGAKDGIVCSASIKTADGHITVHIPVEIFNGQHVMLPNKFATPDIGIKQLTKEEIHSAVKEVNQDNAVLFGKSALACLDYSELRSVMVDAIQKKSYTQCEEILGVIQNKFGDELYAKALTQYQDLLTAVSPNSMKKAASKSINDIKRDNMEGVLISTSKIVFT